MKGSGKQGLCFLNARPPCLALGWLTVSLFMSVAIGPMPPPHHQPDSAYQLRNDHIEMYQRFTLSFLKIYLFNRYVVIPYYRDP